jgi:transmembrane protein 231
MVLYEVYNEPQSIRHYSTVFSRATIFLIITYLIIIVAPFFIVYSTNDLWLYTSTYKEQPQNHFINQWILQITTDDDPSLTKVWSSYYGYNSLLRHQPPLDEIAIPIVKFREDDYNFDRINDHLSLQAIYPNLPYNITGIQGLLFFETHYKSYASVTLQGMIYFSSSWPVSAYKCWMSGDLSLYQRIPFPSSGISTTFNTTIFNDSTVLNFDDYKITNVLKRYHKRNITITMDNVYTHWEHGLGDNFTFQLDLIYPHHVVTYTPGFWQVIKFAWIQYLSVLVVLYVLMKRVESFVYRNQVIITMKPLTDFHDKFN